MCCFWEEGEGEGEGREGSCQSSPDVSEAGLQDNFLEAGTLALLQMNRHQPLSSLFLMPSQVGNFSEFLE